MCSEAVALGRRRQAAPRGSGGRGSGGEAGGCRRDRTAGSSEAADGALGGSSGSARCPLGPLPAPAADPTGRATSSASTSSRRGGWSPATCACASPGPRHRPAVFRLWPKAPHLSGPAPSSRPASQSTRAGATWRALIPVPPPWRSVPAEPWRRARRSRSASRGGSRFPRSRTGSTPRRAPCGSARSSRCSPGSRASAGPPTRPPRAWTPYPWPTLTLGVTPNLPGGIEYPTHIMQGPGTAAGGHAVLPRRVRAGRQGAARPRRSQRRRLRPARLRRSRGVPDRPPRRPRGGRHRDCARRGRDLRRLRHPAALILDPWPRGLGPERIRNGLRRFRGEPSAAGVDHLDLYYMSWHDPLLLRRTRLGLWPSWPPAASGYEAA